ncbi:MAG: efflux RND transporter permease subunit [Rhodanobacteraceae bacterium]|nr:MAG: efflux RND transporter permease subunit [Rhodanobacteraceae bacterium]
MRVPDWLQRPLVWGMLYTVLLGFGAWALWHIPAEVLPRFTFPEISVVVHAPGYATLEMESLVARPLEGQLMGLQGLTSLHTTIDQGSTELDARFTQGTNPQLALQAVYSAIDRARANLPPGVAPYAEIMGNAVNEVADYAVSLPPGVPAWVAENAIRAHVLPALRSLPGVQRVELFGAGPPTLWIQPNPRALIQHHVGVEALAKAIGDAVVLAPAGRLVLGHQDVLLELRDLPQSAHDLLGIPVPTPAGPVPLEALARVVDAPPAVHYGVQLDGRPSLGLVVLKQPDASTVPVDAAVARTLKALQGQLPPGARWVTIYRQAHLVSLIGTDLSRDMLIGGVLAILVLIWLLGRHHGVGVLALSIPTVIVLAIGGLYAFGQSLNLLTLGALTLAVGLLVDDGIIVLEAIQHRWENGTQGWAGVRAGVADIALADITGTLTTIASYLPLLAISGLAGLFMRPFALAMSLALLASLLVSLTLIPLVLGRRSHVGKASVSGQRFLASLTRGNGRLLDFTLRRPGLSLTGAAVLFVISLGALVLVPVNFLPLPNEGVLLDSFTLSPGTSLDQTLATVDRMSAALKADPAVAHVYARIGSAEDTAYTEKTSAGEIQIVLKPGVGINNLSKLAAHLREVARQPGVVQSIDTPTIERVGESLSGLPQPFEITLFGNSVDTLRRLSQQITARLKTVPALTDIFNNDAYPVTQLQIEPRAEVLRSLGLTPASLARQLGLLLRGEVLASVPYGASRLDLYLRQADAPYLDLAQLAREPIFTPKGWVPLSQVAKLDLQAQPNRLEHFGGERALTILATPLRALGSVAADAKAALHGLKLPPGYRISFGGLYPELIHTVEAIGLAIVVALALMLGILALQFGGWRLPLILLLQAPLAFTGGVLLLAMTGVGLNATGLIGLLTLVGISLNHGIVLLTYVRAHEKQGMSPEDAVRTATRERLRPIVLTALTAALGMLPIALGFGEGAAPEQGLAIVVLGGVLWSSVLSTNLLPALYLRWGRARS